FGLFSRLAALMLLGVVATIQIFVYPTHWGEHLTWAAPLLLIFARGAGVISLDHLAGRFFSRER
ncbi:DoxX family protein, partial [Rhizobium sp. 25PS6]|nr:DoxX family protein [Rhizobium sp. 25PS6]